MEELFPVDWTLRIFLVLLKRLILLQHDDRIGLETTV